ncbi:MAG: hypothetical protein E3K32_11045 [wastewater metagenome]|nr:hypothetical protein [Candidatus Loosdrechtia aerotolerans]
MGFVSGTSGIYREAFYGNRRIMIPNPEHIKTFVSTTYTYIGKNKQQEISRLLFEIAKRERIDYTKIAQELPKPPSRFTNIKDYLLRRRYPSLTEENQGIRPSLFDISLRPDLRVDKDSKPVIYPKTLFVEESVFHTGFATRIRNLFPDSKVEIIKTYKDHIGKRRLSIDDYNRRLQDFYLIRENFDFYKRCPCSNESASCGYIVVNLGSGCPYECSYCILQDYINSPGIILPANIEDFFSVFKNSKQNIRCGSGELTDSLVFDHITGYSPQIVEFFRHYPDSSFEFKTKSNNIGLLTSAPGAKNVIVSWSVNPQSVVETVEYFTASMTERLKAAQTCVKCGYRVAFHFDPIIYYQGWESDYKELIHTLLTTIDGRHIAWISLGTLRMTPRLKKIIENRFPDNTILDEEFFTGHDGKLRYPKRIRISLYRNMISWIRHYCTSVPVYLCMEDRFIHSEYQVFS